MKNAPAIARLFFAAWPAPEIQRALGKLALDLKPGCGGRAIPAGNIHLTLAFLGDVEVSRMPQIEALAAKAAAPRFELTVDRVQYWRHNRVVWAGVAQCPAAARQLVGQLESGLAGEGFRVERRPYVPHVTLLRDAQRAPAEERVPAIAWPVARLALVESVPRDRGRAYEVVREWPLVG
jgi:2'-5' RNA ligase